MITDQEIDRRNAEIADAIANAKAHRGGADQAVETRAAVRDTPGYSPRESLRIALKDMLGGWVRVPSTAMEGRPEHEFLRPKAEAALELLDGAIALTKGRTGDRIESARAWLTGERDRIAKALTAFESFGAHLSGPAAVNLIARIAASRNALECAYAAKQYATRATVEAAILETERCLADAREIDRDIAAAVASLALSALPVANDFDRARRDTIDIEALGAKNPTTRQMHRAIEMGLSASVPVARLWAIHENHPDHPLLVLRWKAFCEASGGQ